MPNKWVTVSMRLSRLFFLYKFHVSFAVAVITIRFWPMRKLVLGVRAPISIVLLRKVNKFASIIYCYCVRLWLSDGGSRRMKYKRIPSKRRWSHHVERQSKCCNCKTGDFNFTFFSVFVFDWLAAAASIKRDKNCVAHQNHARFGPARDDCVNSMAKFNFDNEHIRWSLFSLTLFPILSIVLL